MIIQDLTTLSIPTIIFPPKLSYLCPFPQIIKSMFSFNSVLQSLNPSKIVSGLANNYNKLKDRMIPPLAITEIVPCIYHIDFPQRSNVTQLAQHIGSSSYLIWNISEYPYEDDFATQLALRNPNGKMQHLNFQYYCNLPFYELIQAIQDIQSALKDPNQKVYIHCQEGKVRSAAFLASYLFVTSSLGMQDISEAIHHINKKLGINLESKGINYKNQHTLFKNLVNYITDQNFVNKKKLELQRLAINNAPKIKPLEMGNLPELMEVQVMIQVRCGPDVVYKAIQKETVTSGESICIDFQKAGKKVHLGDEFLIIVKYLYKKQLYNVLRIQANTNFIFNHFSRLHQHDIDLSGFCQPHKHITFIDLTFKQSSSFSKLSKINSPPQQKKSQSFDLLSGEGISDSNVTVPEQQFAWFQDQPQIDEHQLNSKIKEVMQNMNKKEQQRDLDKQSQSQQDQDFQDYLGKLQSQIQ